MGDRGFEGGSDEIQRLLGDISGFGIGVGGGVCGVSRCEFLGTFGFVLCIGGASSAFSLGRQEE
jgi:hypothetical protein